MGARRSAWLVLSALGASGLSCSGQKGPEVLVSNMSGLFLSVDDVDLYWTDTETKTVFRAPKSDPMSAIEPLGTGFKPVVIDHVVFSTTSQPLPQMTTVVRYGPRGPDALGSFVGDGFELASDGKSLFLPTAAFGDPISKIWSQPLDGSAATLLAESADVPFHVAAGGGEVIWLSLSFVNGVLRGGAKLMKSPAGGGDAVELAAFPQATEDAGGFALDSTNVYVAIDATTVAVPCKFEDLFRVDRGTGQVTKLLTAGKIRSVAVDAQNIYFSDLCEDTINRLPIDALPGTKAVVIVAAPPGEGPASPVDTKFLALDDRYVYWTTDHNGGAIERIAKAP
jgi:hypothetical protein